MSYAAAFGPATITIPAQNLSIPLAGNSLGNLTAQNATNATTGQIIQSQQQTQQNQSANQTTNNANAQNQQTHQSVIFENFSSSFQAEKCHTILVWKEGKNEQTVQN